MERIALPYFDNVEVKVYEEIDLTIPEASAALNTFLKLTPEDRSEDASHVYAYYKDIHRAVGGEDWMDGEMGIPQVPSEIWRSVVPTGLMLLKDLVDDGHWYIGVIAECAWEREHGLWIVWRDGCHICKVGEYDGHVSNATATADDSLKNVVYDALDEEFRTYFEERKAG